MNVKVVGIDLAKNVFQVCVLLNDGNIAWNRKITRTKLLHTLRQFPAKPLIAMETCSTSHHWARQYYGSQRVFDTSSACKAFRW